MQKEQPLLIVGLGNPGKEYVSTRHNVGFMIIDRLAERLKTGGSFEPDKKSQSLLLELSRPEGKIFLAKPQTFMNLSGRSVRSLFDYYKLAADRLLVIHDDLDLPFGKIRLSLGASSGGHNGVASVIEHLGTDQFSRLRFGIGLPANLLAKTEEKDLRRTPIPSEKFVLQSFSTQEKSALTERIQTAAEAVECFADFGFSSSANQFN